MSKLECIDFSVKYFGYDAAISGITTTFSDGINVIYAGEKGGKTTFLKALAGVIAYDGEVRFDDVDLKEISLKDRDFQMLFDDYALFSRHSARYNLEYPLKLRKIPKEQRIEMVEKAAELFDLDLMIDAPVYRLNLWHKISLVLCRAYLRKAKVLLIDNIFSRLDPESRREAFLRYIPLVSQNGIVIYATDEVREAAALSREIKYLSYGYILQEGSAEELVQKPACMSALAAFGDHPSLLPCTVASDGIVLFNKAFPCDLPLISDEYMEKEAIAGFALGDLTIGDDGFSATVEGKFFHGNNNVYRLSSGGLPLYLYSDLDLPVGAEVSVCVKNAPKLFDAINERAILRY